jgi:hypothetical protein
MFVTCNALVADHAPEDELLFGVSLFVLFDDDRFGEGVLVMSWGRVESKADGVCLRVLIVGISNGGPHDEGARGESFSVS